MAKNLQKVFAIYRKHTRPHQAWAFASMFSFASATFFQNVLAPMFVATILSLMTKKNIHVMHEFWWLIGAIVTANVFFRFADWFLISFKNRSSMVLQQKALETIITQPHHFFTNNHSGALIARMNRFVKSFEGMFDSIAYTFLFSIIQVVGIFFVLFFKSAILGLTLLCWAIIYMFVSTKMAKIRVPVDRKEAQQSSDLTAVGSDILSNAITVLIFGQRKKEISNYKEQNALYAHAQKKSWLYSNFQNTIQGVLTASLEMGSLFIAITLWLKGMLIVADVALVYLYMKVISNTMWEVGRTFVRFTKYNTDAYEMVEIFEKVPEVDMTNLYEEQSIMDGSVVIKNLTFSYSIGKNVFDSLNLTIEHGQHVGVVGSTGAGKSTLIAMLMKLRDPIGGIIEIGGSDIAEMVHDSLRRQIAIVPQDVSLLHRTVFENISYGKENATLEEVMAAAKKGKIHDEIMTLSGGHGYQTVVGERGIKLSGGQRQRVAIARALLIDAKIIILDEATSSLDAITETYIQDILQNHLEGRTVIIIAHRLATVRHCDRIIVLSDGKITEDGPHEALMQNDGTYSELVRHQFAH